MIAAIGTLLMTSFTLAATFHEEPVQQQTSVTIEAASNEAINA